MSIETWNLNIRFWIEERNGEEFYNFWDKQFKLRSLTKNETIEATGYPEEYIISWLMNIWKDIIFHYWINRDYLKYFLLNEVLCPDPIWDNVEIWTCALTLPSELLLVPEDIKYKYIKSRIKFFEGIKKLSDDWLNFPGDDDSNKKYSIEMQLCVELLVNELSKYEYLNVVDTVKESIKDIK